MRRRNTKKRLALIAEHEPKVHKAVSTFLRQHPEFGHLKDDLTSEGFLRLVDSVDRFLNGHVKKLPAYLRLSIRSGLWEAARTDDVIQSPRNCPARRNDKFDLGSQREDESSSDEFESTSSVLKFCDDRFDELIVAMLRAGNTLKDIASALEMKPEEIEQRAYAIGQRAQA